MAVRDPLTAAGVVWTLCLLLAFSAVLGGVVYLLGEGVTGEAAAPVRTDFDRPLLEWFEDQRSPGRTSIAKTVTDMGGAIAIIFLLVGGATLSYVLTRDARWPIFFVAVLTIAPQLSGLLKELVDRPRPTLSPIYEHLPTAAFPSGHATNSAAAYFAVAFFLAWISGKKVAVWMVAAIVVLSVAITRVYLGVHWPTDVLGGWLLGGLCVALCAVVIKPGEPTAGNQAVDGYPAT